MIQTTKRYFAVAEPYIGPLAITLASAYVRLYEIGIADRVIWDEAHFGKFGAYYLKHEFYFDVHPPLGKLLIGLSGYLAGFNGSYLFESGEYYPEHVDYVSMRVFNAIFGILVAPLSYYTAKALGFNLWSVYLVSLSVTFENCFVVLSKFILLDSMLLFFTAMTFLCMAQLHRRSKIENSELTFGWLKWLFFTGVSIGCVCSVKWVGLFVTALVGLYTVLDLFAKYIDETMSRKVYYKHWLLRVINLIVVPATIYILAFKVHFQVLYKAGTGHASMPSLFQINLQESDIEASPRNVAYGSKVTLRSHGLSPNLLHSHVQLYPLGSRQHQVTTYGYKDSNNDWELAPSRASKKPRYNPKDATSVEYVADGDQIRLVHLGLRSNLHSHRIPAHVSKNAYEVSGYGSEIVGDEKDDWIVEIVEQIETPTEPGFTKNKTFSSLVHPISTNFRLKHADIGCYLATTGAPYPAWGFKQGEVVCKHSFFKRDKSTWWNVEDHSHPNMTADEEFVRNPPQSYFWRDFILLNFAMQASNNALVPDKDRYDALASEWWEWFILNRGLRMSSWNTNEKKFYMMPNPLVLWLSSASILTFAIIVIYKAYLWQQQLINYNDKQFWQFATLGFAPFLGWILHYFPFVIMARVTYVHHYVPAEYFAIFVAAYVIESLLKNAHKTTLEKVTSTYTQTMPSLHPCFYTILYLLIVGAFQYFSPVSHGMSGPAYDFGYLRWWSTWNIHD